jgi:anti-sigma-K factor RskA
MTHQEQVESAAAYALGALDPDARASFEAHLASCAVCLAELAAHREVVALLALAAPSAKAGNGPALRERILREAKSVRPITIASRRQVSWRYLASGAAAASLIFAVLTGQAWRRERDEAARLAGALASARADIARRDSTLAAFFGPEVHVVSLSETTKKPAARVYWNHTKKVFIVTAFNIPAAPEGKTYQLWAIRKGKAPLSMGTFDTDDGGRALAVVPVPAEINDGGFIDDCALTLEPAGGSTHPTETPRLLGAWRHVD